MKALRILSLLTGILLIIAGALVIDTPIANVVGLSYFLIIAMIATGAAEVIMFFTSRTKKFDWWLMISGIISLGLGLWALLGKGNIIGISILLPIFFSIWLLASGIMRIIGSFRMKRLGSSLWWLFLLIGILATAFAIYLIINPAVSGFVLGLLVPIVFIYQGISSVVQFFILKY